MNYTYDAEPVLSGAEGNRLIQVQQSSTVQASFVYDGRACPERSRRGNRVMATVGGVTTMYAGKHYEYVNSTTYTKYYDAGGDLIAFERSSGYGSTAGNGRRFVLRDHPSTALRTSLGSTSVIINGQGATIANDLYLPGACPEPERRGDVRYQWRTGTPPIATQTQYRYTSQRLEVGVGAPSPVGGLDRGLYFYGARWYDASLARFVQPDTIVSESGNPQSLNRYSYTLNNPLRYTDPNGHCVVPASPFVMPACWEIGIRLLQQVEALAVQYGPQVTQLLQQWGDKLPVLVYMASQANRNVQQATSQTGNTGEGASWQARYAVENLNPKDIVGFEQAGTTGRVDIILRQGSRITFLEAKQINWYALKDDVQGQVAQKIVEQMLGHAEGQSVYSKVVIEATGSIPNWFINLLQQEGIIVEVFTP